MEFLGGIGLGLIYKQLQQGFSGLGYAQPFFFQAAKRRIKSMFRIGHCAKLRPLERQSQLNSVIDFLRIIAKERRGVGGKGLSVTLT